MNKFIVASLILTVALTVSFAKLYLVPTGVKQVPYLNYKEEFAYNLKNPLIEMYRRQVIDQTTEILED